MKIVINGLMVILIATLPGCLRKKCNKSCPATTKMESKVTIPFSRSTGGTEKEMGPVDSFFDEDDDTMQQLIKQDDVLTQNNEATNTAGWLEQDAQPFELIYFDFDKRDIRTDQKGAVEKNAHHVKTLLAEAAHQGTRKTVVVEGHACPITKSGSYNMACSEERAATVAKVFEEQGVPPYAMKVVGRGSEVPALVDGKPVTGSTKEQLAPNRRVELHIINA